MWLVVARQRNNCVRTALETARFKAFGAQNASFEGEALSSSQMNVDLRSVCAPNAVFPQTQFFLCLEREEGGRLEDKFLYLRRDISTGEISPSTSEGEIHVQKHGTDTCYLLVV